VLLLVLPVVCVLVACLGLALCRLAARSDSTQGVRLDELLASGYRMEHERLVADHAHVQLPFDRRSAAG
jgi:hypothetical protein